MYEERESPHELVHLVWRAGGELDGDVVVEASEHWGIAFARDRDGQTSALIAGPSLQAQEFDWFAGEEYWGVELPPYVAWRGLDKGPLLGRLIDVTAGDGWCEIAGVRLRIPAAEDLEEFVGALERQGILVADADVRAALTGAAPYWSGRTMQRRFRGTTGMGRKQLEQVRRARSAYALLQEGIGPAEVAAATGYADQAHLTRSLKVLAGQTPARILAALED